MKKERTTPGRPARLRRDGRYLSEVSGCVCEAADGDGVCRLRGEVTVCNIFHGFSLVRFWSFPARLVWKAGSDEVEVFAVRSFRSERFDLPVEAKRAFEEALSAFKEREARKQAAISAIRSSGVFVPSAGEGPSLYWLWTRGGKVDAVIEYVRDGETVSELHRSRSLRTVVGRFLSLGEKGGLYGEWYPVRVPLESDRFYRAALEADDVRAAKAILRVRRQRERRLARRGYVILPPAADTGLPGEPFPPKGKSSL